MSIGKNIRDARKRNGLTQKQLGEKCGMADSAIRRYELDRGNPTIETLRRIATALDMALIDLAGDKFCEVMLGPEADKAGNEFVSQVKTTLSMLEHIYGPVECVTVSGAFAETYFYYFPKADPPFALYEDRTIHELYNVAIGAMKVVVDHLKDFRSKADIEAECLLELDNNEILKQFYEAEYAQYLSERGSDSTLKQPYETDTTSEHPLDPPADE